MFFLAILASLREKIFYFELFLKKYVTEFPLFRLWSGRSGYSFFYAHRSRCRIQDIATDPFPVRQSLRDQGVGCLNLRWPLQIPQFIPQGAIISVFIDSGIVSLLNSCFLSA